MRIAYDAKSLWDYAEGHFRVWDSAFSSSPWEGIIKVQPPPAGLHKIRPLVGYDLVLQSYFETHLSGRNVFLELIVFSSIYVYTLDLNSYFILDGLTDEILPIDVIFFGSLNPHRQSVYDRLTKMTINGNALRIEFHRKAYGAQRDSLLDSAKV